MQRRTLCCPLQMVQYLSQVQRSSGKSHCMHTVGPCMRTSLKTLPEPWRSGKAKVKAARESFTSSLGSAANSLFAGSGSVSDNPTNQELAAFPTYR